MNPCVGTVFTETVMIRDVRKFSFPLLLLGKNFYHRSWSHFKPVSSSCV